MELVFKNRIKETREKKGFSQAKLAEIVGTTRQTIIAIEKGTFSPTARLACLICLALDTKFEDLFYFE
ncbi:MAG: helix-turn-helix transcriptional regulator [Clostridia bacterium]|nr:helix-turn-helix transcriptional regulator [Clostridia bacterium]